MQACGLPVPRLLARSGTWMRCERCVVSNEYTWYGMWQLVHRLPAESTGWRVCSARRAR